MIVEIEAAAGSAETALNYNEKKVMEGVARLIGYAGLRDPSQDCIYGTFARLERGRRYPVSRVGFHASVNPSPEDGCTEDQVLDFIAGLMDHLGYGDQPFLVYRHFDIEREHYHIVSLRIDREGRKINDYYEIKRTRDYMRSVARKYNFSVIEKGMRVNSVRSLQRKERSAGLKLRFNPDGEVFSQFHEIWDEALRYDFDSTDQLARVLEDFGVHMEVRSGYRNGRAIYLQGLDASGKAVTQPFGEMELGRPLHRMAAAVASSAEQRHFMRFRERERVRSIVRSAFTYSRSEAHFRNILSQKGIGMHLSVTDAGEVFGISFVDHVTATVFKGSEIPDVISVQKMQDAIRSGRWRAQDKGPKRGAYIRAVRKAATEEALALRDREAGVIARVLTPIGQPYGNSWSGKTPKTKDQLIEEYEMGKSGALDANFEDTRFEEKLG